MTQLLRRLRQQENEARHHKNHDRISAETYGAQASRSGKVGRAAGGDESGRCATSAATTATRGGANIARLHFSPADAWDDTGLFTVAPRPKTVPLPPQGSGTKRNRRSQEQEQRRQRPTLETHTLASPVFASRGWPSSPTPAVLPDSRGSSRGGAVVGTIAPSELWHKGEDFGAGGVGGLGASSDGFGLWPKRRRKVCSVTFF